MTFHMFVQMTSPSKTNQGKDKSSQNLFQDMKIIVDGLSYLNSDFFFILLEWSILQALHFCRKDLQGTEPTQHEQGPHQVLWKLGHQ